MRNSTATQLEKLTATPVDIPVCWARYADDLYWRGSEIDRFLRWNGSVWCARGMRGMFTATLDPVRENVVEHRGRLLGIHPDRYGLVMEETRTLVLLPIDALRVAE